jgi:hypothetical protein
VVAGQGGLGGVDIALGLVMGGAGAKFVGSVPEGERGSLTSNELR